MAAPEKKPLSPQAARAQERRDAKLADMAEQVSDGSLVVRQMTAAERKRFAERKSARPAPAPRSAKR